MHTTKKKLLLLGLMGMLTACTVDIENKHAADEWARLAQAPGSVPLGWKIFQDRCASCHGPAALGSANAPNLLPLVRDMDLRRFATLVLQRYDWGNPVQEQQVKGANSVRPSPQTAANTYVPPKENALTMPAWQGEPRVTAHITDVYAYLSARAQGAQGPGRPVP